MQGCGNKLPWGGTQGVHVEREKAAPPTDAAPR